MAEVRNIPGVGLVRKNDDGTFEVMGDAPAPQGRVFTLPQNPKDARTEARQANADARADGADARAAAAAARSEREWNATHNPDGTPKKGGTTGGKPLPDAVAKRYESAIDAFADYDRAVAGFNDDFAGNTITGGLENTLQSKLGTGTPGQAQWWSDFAATDNMIRNALFGASLTAGEKAAYEKTSINPSMDPAQIRTNLERRMTLAKEKLGRRTSFLKANGYDPDAVDALAGEYGEMLREAPAAKPADKEPVAAANAPDDTTPMGIATGATRQVPNERANGLINSLMNAGASKPMIDAMLAKQGLPPVRVQDYTAAKAWMAKNPGQRYNAANATDLVPMSALERAAGSTVGSGVANYADAATAGISTALAGDRGRGALDAMNATNPNAAAVGSILGGITGAGAAELGAGAALGGRLAGFAPRIADTIYGGVSGFNGANDGEGGMGALTGAGIGLAGGLIGEGAMRTAGAAFRGITDPAVQALRSRGVPMTVGQAVGNSGTFGAGVKKLEDAATSVPFVGNMIEARRMDGLRGFNDAAFQDAAAPGAMVTGRGAEGMQQVRQSVGDAYDNALGPVNIDANDPQFFADLVALQRQVGAIPNVNGAQDAAEAGLRSRIDGAIDPMTDQISGRGFQEAYRGLARTGRERANGDYGHEIGQTMRGGQDALAGALERQNPGAFDGFLEANAANRRANVLADALKNAANQGDELITPAQLNRADVTSTSRLEGKINSAAGNRPFYDLATAGQSVLPSRLPDSGTGTRALVGLGLTGGLSGAGYAAGGAEGAGAGGGAGLAATLALAFGGSRGAQNVATRMLLDRPDVALRIGEELRRHAAIGGGTAGAGILAGIVGQ